MFFYSFKASSRSSFISFSKRNRKLLVAKSSTRISKKSLTMTLDLCIFIWKLLQMSYLSFYHFGIFYQFLSDFIDFIIDLSRNTVWPQDSGFRKFAKLTIFGIFAELLSTQIVNVARFACNVELDFFYDFQTLFYCSSKASGAKYQKVSSVLPLRALANRLSHPQPWKMHSAGRSAIYGLRSAHLSF